MSRKRSIDDINEYSDRKYNSDKKCKHDHTYFFEKTCPKELLEIILSNMNTKQERLNSMLVCKNWLDTIRKTVYYDCSLSFASWSGNIKLVKHLIKDKRLKGFSNHRPGKYSGIISPCTALTYAVMNDHSEIVEILLEDKRFDPTENHNDVLVIASLNGFTNIVKLLIKDNRINFKFECEWAIKFAVRNGKLSVVRELLQHAGVPWIPSLLADASRFGHYDIVKFFLDENYFSEYEVDCALHAGRDHNEIVNVLLEYKMKNKEVV